MIHEEAIERIKRLLKNNSFTKADKNALKLTIEALEKHIPKKPIKNGIGGYICPHCNGVILDFTHELYHKDCGGRLE